MPNAIYNEPAPEGYEQYGWTCVYHRVFCHNPSDCDFVPLWRRKRQARDVTHWRRWSHLSDEEREAARGAAR